MRIAVRCRNIKRIPLKPCICQLIACIHTVQQIKHIIDAHIVFHPSWQSHGLQQILLTQTHNTAIPDNTVETFHDVRIMFPYGQHTVLRYWKTAQQR